MRTKHLLLLTIIGSGLLFSCGPNASEKRLRHLEDSLRNADSIANAEAEAAALAEQTLLDSIRKDSIERVEKIIVSMPTFKEINDKYGNLENLFKQRGFTISYNKGTIWNPESCDEEYYPRIVAKLNSGGSPSFTYAENDNGYKVTIIGAPDKLEKFGNDAKVWAKKMRNTNPNDWYYQEFKASVAGNTVTVYWPTGD